MVNPSKPRGSPQKSKSTRLFSVNQRPAGLPSSHQGFVKPLPKDQPSTRFTSPGAGPSRLAFQSPSTLSVPDSCLSQILASDSTSIFSLADGFSIATSLSPSFSQQCLVQRPCLVPTLEQLVVHFIVSNIECIRSLKGVPEHVGFVLLNAFNEFGVWENQNQLSEAAFNLFIDAYGSKVLSSFVAQGFLLSQYIAKCSHFVARSLRFVTSLDLSSCGLEADEILLSLGTFQNLQMLNLADNNLSAEGIHMLLVRQKVYRDCFQNLKYLNLHKCHLIGSNLSTVLDLPKLERLCFSVCLDGIVKKNFDLRPHGGRVTFLIPTTSTKKTVEQYLSESGFQRDSESYKFSIEDSGILCEKLKQWMVSFVKSCEPKPKFKPDKAYLCLSGMCVETYTDPYEKKYDHYYVFRGTRSPKKPMFPSPRVN